MLLLNLSNDQAPSHVEWTVPAVPCPSQGGPSKEMPSASEGHICGLDGSDEETIEIFAFALEFEISGIHQIRNIPVTCPASDSWRPSTGT
ncbi:PREDICTED: uncharacterized protein LOC104753113 isoform X3 [Camelina sativa]|uniref:Uncharacterized protein LOC104753113 isoform X3 n=1 Tax=Camelina sativa TaxID=90675 RepID=A0ABM0WNM2_CAMSA|nr:PREDICTED: uncharacterized protein LOC104753113 isoform X3 [Camelina sativa]